MPHPAIDPQWLALLLARAQQPPRRQRVPLMLGSHRIGTVEPDFFDPITDVASTLIAQVLQRDESHAVRVWRVLGDGTLALGRIARVLRDTDTGQVVRQWRDEQLAVVDLRGELLATVERGVVRPLGIATRAVHLVVRTHDGGFWVQQRALNKANDPGLWDTTMGGMVSAADTLESALARETWEEAGLRLEQFQGLARGGRVAMNMPCVNDEAGYVVEQIDWFVATLADGVEPNNLDGEVAQFQLLDERELLSQLQQNIFTTEAALILVAALTSV
jgi:8-oxo-dGTP pyrophosphatase MutT (NUDIX family)